MDTAYDKKHYRYILLIGPPRTPSRTLLLAEITTLQQHGWTVRGSFAFDIQSPDGTSPTVPVSYPGASVALESPGRAIHVWLSVHPADPYTSPLAPEPTDPSARPLFFAVRAHHPIIDATVSTGPVRH